MDKLNTVHCMFEQSGTFKNEFKKFGIKAYDYDLQNEFGQTDYKVDLFDEIHRAFEGWESIFDRVWGEDLIIAFFPCTRFSARIPLCMRGEAYQQKNWNDLKKLEYSLKLHHEMDLFYSRISELVVIALRKGLRLIIENPYTPPHHLTGYWCIKPSVIDKDRTQNGDWYKKPTQFFFINCVPENNEVTEQLEPVELKKIGKTHNQVERSMIHPQYARRFIKRYILPGENKNDG